MNVQQLLAASPQFHRDYQGAATSYAPKDEAVLALADSLTPGMRTIETGSGLTTVVFALCGCRHTAITPRQTELDAIRAFCDERSVPTSELSLICGRSEWRLAGLATDERFDVALIDGRHAFPSPILDWFYLTEALEVGGLLALDDVALPSCAILADFMNEDPRFEVVRAAQSIALWRKLEDHLHRGEFILQPWSMNRIENADQVSASGPKPGDPQWATDSRER